jgi:hypothetical protein
MHRMRTAVVLASRSVLVLVASLLSACGPVLSASVIDDADTTLEQAREKNARWYAPYEYYFAEANLETAREEASEAEYEAAIHYAKAAREYGTRALRLAEQQRMRER